MAGAVAAIVVAAGRGSRFGGLPKQYRLLGATPVTRLSLETLVRHEEVQVVQPVIHPDDRNAFAEAANGLLTAPPVLGGATRQDSVRAGMEALADVAPDIVLIHDAARPFVTRAMVSRAISVAKRTGAAIPAVPVVDTIKRVDDEGVVVDTVDREFLRAIQTPQAFDYARLLAAHRLAFAQGATGFTDDAALAEWADLPVSIFEGDRDNVKLTTADDLDRAQRRGGDLLADVRTATGFDVHAFEDGDHVMLGGIRIPHTHKLSGHSDADVVLHALTDAVLGALCDGDIGAHFPPSDPTWRGAASDQFLAFAADRVRKRGGAITLLDVTLLCEAPRVGAHRDAMRARIAAIANISVDRVAVKATTTEQLGFLGRREGIAALATATIRLPGTPE